jgi:hypothetical protein
MWDGGASTGAHSINALQNGCFEPVSIESQGVELEYGPDEADGATGPLWSVWIRDPDGNLVELARRRSAQPNLGTGQPVDQSQQPS